MKTGKGTFFWRIGKLIAATPVAVALFLLTAPVPASAQSSGGSIIGINVEWSPDGRSISFAADWDGDLEIYLMDIDGQKITQLTDNDRRDLLPSFARDGKSVLYSSSVDGRMEIHRVSVNGGPPTTVLSDPGAGLTWPEEAADGRILFAASIINGGGATDIRVFDPNSGGVTTLVGDGSRNTTPTWLPDGAGILFASNRSGQQHIYAADADGSNQRQLTRLPEGVDRYGSARPSVTPDGRRVVYWGDEGGFFKHDHHHNVLDLTSGETKVLPKRILSMAYPDVSPDGRQIIYLAGLGGSRPFSVYVMDLDGSNHRVVWEAPALRN